MGLSVASGSAIYQSRQPVLEKIRERREQLIQYYVDSRFSPEEEMDRMSFKEMFYRNNFCERVKGAIDILSEFLED